MDFIELQTFLNQNEIPKIKGKPKTFLEIAKQPHYENVISNIYAFFFNVNEDHQLNDLFIKSLLILINNSALALEGETFENFDVFTEYGTTNQKRIDILLQSNTQAIIIENKVYHHLNNDLDEYFNEIEVPVKVGIVLSLHPISDIQHLHFINITHLELLQAVITNLGNYVMSASDKYVVFLKDFYQNILNISTPIMEDKKLKFYFDNKTKINQLVTLKTTVKTHIIAEVEKAGKSLDGLDLYSGRKHSDMDNRYRYYVSQKNNNLLFTIIFDKIYDAEGTIQLIIELKNKALKDREQYNKINFTEEERKISFTDNFKNTNDDWAHFALKEYNISTEEISNLSSFIIQKLKEDGLMSIFKKLELFLGTYKTNHQPVQ